MEAPNFFCFQMCNRLPEIMKNGDAGIFPVYYSLKKNIYAKCRILRYYFTAKLVHRKIQKTISCIWLIFKNNKISLSTLCFWYVCGTYCSRSSLLRKSAHKKTMLSTYQLTSVEQQNTKTGDNAFQIIKIHRRVVRTNIAPGYLRAFTKWAHPRKTHSPVRAIRKKRIETKHKNVSKPSILSKPSMFRSRMAITGGSSYFFLASVAESVKT